MCLSERALKEPRSGGKVKYKKDNKDICRDGNAGSLWVVLWVALQLLFYSYCHELYSLKRQNQTDTLGTRTWRPSVKFPRLRKDLR